MALKTKISDALAESFNFATAIKLVADGIEADIRPAKAEALHMLADKICGLIEQAHTALDELDSRRDL